MQRLVLIRALPGGSYQWYGFGAGPCLEQTQGTGSLADMVLAQGKSRYSLCLLVPGDRVSTRIVPLVLRERRHMRQAVPYQLEDCLLGDIEQLQFAFGQWSAGSQDNKDGDAQVACGWCDKDWLQQTLLPFADMELDLACVVPEPLLLSRSQGWTLRLEDTLWCHIDIGYGFAIDPALASEVLTLLYQAWGAPSVLALSATSEQDLGRLRDLLPAPLQALASSRRESLSDVFKPWAEVWLAGSGEPELNLLQQDFAPRIPLTRWWRQWRSVAALLCATLVAWAAETWLYTQQQQMQQEQMQAQIEQAFRSVIPQGMLVDAEKQLDNRLANLGGDAGYRGPVSLIARMAPVFEQGDGITLSGLSYNMRQGDVRLSCRAQSFAAIEQLRSRLSQAGLEAELIHSSADGEGQQARFRIRWGHT